MLASLLPRDFCPLLETGLSVGDSAVTPGCLLLLRGGGGGGTFLAEMLGLLLSTFLDPVSCNTGEDGGDFERLNLEIFELLDKE